MSTRPPKIPENVTVHDVFEWYSGIRPHKTRNAHDDREQKRIWDLFLAICGNQKCSDCRPVILEKLIAEQPGLNSNWSRCRWNKNIQRPFNKAVRHGIITSNPFASVKFEYGEAGREMTDAEFQAILRNSPPHYRRILVFLRFSGARPGEARAIEWRHVDFEANVIVLPPEKTKSQSTHRTIPLGDVTAKLLRWCRRNNKNGSRFAFPNKYGGGWTLQALVNHMSIVRERAKLPAGVNLYGLRHAFAARAIRDGVDLATLGGTLGDRHLFATRRYFAERKPGGEK